MDAAIFPTMLNLSQLPVSPPPDHKLFFNNHNNNNSHCPTSQTPAAVLANPLLMKSFVREMEGPTVKKAPSLLEKHYSKRTALEAQQQQQQQQQQQHIPKSQPPFTAQKQPDTPTSVTPSTGSASSSAETKVQSPPADEHNHKTHQPQSSPLPQSPSSPQQQQKQQQPPPFSPSSANPFLHLADPTKGGGPPEGGIAPNDPKYIQMVSRMAAYYQQRCQAILNFQQQRCQTWATSHRQKCQEMMQAAMLVVAWYIRDRIGRRRRRNKRAFRRGLREKNTAAVLRRVPKGETVRKWVMDIPEASRPASASSSALEVLMMSSSSSPPGGNADDSAAAAAAAAGIVLDAEERAFDVEKEVIPDKDSQLFAVADQMIKSQLAKIDVPLLGALNLDDSDSETDDDDEDMDKYYNYGPAAAAAADDYDMEGEEVDGEVEYDDDDDDLDYEEEDSFVEDEASKEAMHGTGKGSLKRKRSESTSDEEYVGVKK